VPFPGLSRVTDDAHIECVALKPIGPANLPPRPWAYGYFLLFGCASVLGAMDGGGKFMGHDTRLKSRAADARLGGVENVRDVVVGGVGLGADPQREGGRFQCPLRKVGPERTEWVER
jgi:hypothetical protein